MKNKNGGFTMIELVIVMALMAILWGVAYAMFYQSQGVFTTSSRKLEMYQNARITMDTISRDLKGATLKDNVDYFRSFTTSDPGVDALNPSPRSNSSILTFLSLTSNGSSTPVTLITYYLTNADELVRAEYNDTSYIYGTVTGFYPEDATYYKLAQNMDYFNLQYATGSSWLGSWDSSTDGAQEGHLPDSVRVTVQIYGTGTGNIRQTGTFTTELTVPFR